jgi:hypothetical protein
VPEPDEPEINENSVVPEEITLETPDDGDDETTEDLADGHAPAREAADTAEPEAETADTIGAEDASQGADDTAADEPAVEDVTTDDADRTADQTDEAVAADSVVDDVYTGVVDVSSDVVDQVGGEFVGTDSEETVDGERTADGDGAVEEDVELDLTEPETEESDDEVEESGGNHGVPDSL